MINIYKRIISSIKFRFKIFLRKKIEKKLNNKIERHHRKIVNVKMKSFSIISSNCWAGSVYEDLKLPYQSPTIGLFIYAPCYVEFLKNLKFYLAKNIVFIETSKYQDANIYRSQNFIYPIGILDNQVEIHFLHYKTKEEAIEKWERRKSRIVWNKLYVAMTDRDLCTYELMQEFDSLPFKKKVLFTAKNYPEIRCAVQLKTYKGNKEVGDLYNQKYSVTKEFEIKKWLEE